VVIKERIRMVFHSNLGTLAKLVKLKFTEGSLTNDPAKTESKSGSLYSRQQGRRPTPQNEVTRKIKITPACRSRISSSLGVYHEVPSG
jgi:hypothetical protein